jgi:hypothetical protein
MNVHILAEVKLYAVGEVRYRKVDNDLAVYVL